MVLLRTIVRGMEAWSTEDFRLSKNCVYWRLLLITLKTFKKISISYLRYMHNVKKILSELYI